jgi:hypothetical protein
VSAPERAQTYWLGRLTPRPPYRGLDMG